MKPPSLIFVTTLMVIALVPAGLAAGQDQGLGAFAANGIPPGFASDIIDAWRDVDSANAGYGGLARDGVSCTVCHHIADPMGQDQFTGNFDLTHPVNLNPIFLP